MNHLQYRERDYAFGQAMLTLRTASGLTQEGLANFLGISRQAVVGWEAGGSYPQIRHLKQFLTLCIQQQAFTPGHEADEIRAFWKAAHQKVLFDENWLDALLDNLRSSAAPEELRPIGDTSTNDQVLNQPVLTPKVDLGNILAVPTFYGRGREVEIITSWILDDHCRLVSVLGLDGIGKPALAINLMHQLAGHFEVVIWRSLWDAPACEAFLDDCIKVLAPEPLGVASASIERCND